MSECPLCMGLGGAVVASDLLYRPLPERIEYERHVAMEQRRMRERGDPCQLCGKPPLPTPPETSHDR